MSIVLSISEDIYNFLCSVKEIQFNSRKEELDLFYEMLAKSTLEDDHDLLCRVESKRTLITSIHTDHGYIKYIRLYHVDIYEDSSCNYYEIEYDIKDKWNKYLSLFYEDVSEKLMKKDFLIKDLINLGFEGKLDDIEIYPFR